jgi:hypothetical protein
MIKIIASLLLIAGARCYYSYARIDYDKTLDCTSCIRGGYDFCLMIGGNTTATITNWTCNLNGTTPEISI